MKTKKIIKTALYITINPHLIPCIIFAGLLLSTHKSMSFLADKIDDAARSLGDFDKSLAKKHIPTWIDSLVDGDDE